MWRFLLYHHLAHGAVAHVQYVQSAHGGFYPAPGGIEACLYLRPCRRGVVDARGGRGGERAGELRQHAALGRRCRYGVEIVGLWLQAAYRQLHLCRPRQRGAHGGGGAERGHLRVVVYVYCVGGRAAHGCAAERHAVARRHHGHVAFVHHRREPRHERAAVRHGERQVGLGAYRRAVFPPALKAVAGVPHGAKLSRLAGAVLVKPVHHARVLDVLLHRDGYRGFLLEVVEVLPARAALVDVGGVVGYVQLAAAHAHALERAVEGHGGVCPLAEYVLKPGAAVEGLVAHHVERGGEHERVEHVAVVQPAVGYHLASFRQHEFAQPRRQVVGLSLAVLQLLRHGAHTVNTHRAKQLAEVADVRERACTGKWHFKTLQVFAISKDAGL